MQFETFRGRTMQEALAQLKAALGPDALIESTRHVASGEKGWLDRSFVEIVAAAMPSAGNARKSSKPRASSAAPSSSSSSSSRSMPPAVKAKADTAIDSELRVIRSLLEEISHGKRPRDRAAALLNNAGIEGALSASLSAETLRAARSKPAELLEMLRGRLMQRLAVLPSPIEAPGPHIIACIGPTGVGKTTTIAKLAARAHLELGRSVAVITLDTFRVGAVEQMRRFVELIGVPLEVARDRSSFAQALAHRRADLVLVDTAGAASADGAGMQRLADCLAAAGERTMDVLLVVQAAIRARDALRLKSVYRDAAPTGLIVTKLDETSQAGGALHAALEEPLPLAYLCDGPKVPEDIHDASVEALVDAVLPSST